MRKSNEDQRTALRVFGMLVGGTIISLFLGWIFFQLSPARALFFGASIFAIIFLVLTVRKKMPESVLTRKEKRAFYLRKTRTVLLSVTISFGVSFLVLGAMFMSLEFEQSVYIENQTGIVVYSIQKNTPWAERLFWDNDPIFNDTSRHPFGKEIVAMKFSGPHSVTENPKVRNIAYNIKVNKFGSVESFLAHRKTATPKGGTKEWVAFWLYEFNEAKSKDVAKFYNPKDLKQQKEFRDLLENFLRPYLRRAGLTLVKAEFYIPGQV